MSAIPTADGVCGADTILKVEGVSKTFPGTRALSNVHLDVKYGEVHALMGENGAGKSTLMNIITGVFAPDCGTITFMGRKVRFANPRESQRAGIGFVHQELALCGHLSAAENMFMGALPASAAGIINHRALHAEARRLLGLLKSPVRPETPVAELTIAEQQVVEIAKSLSLDCKLLILDEPTSSLTEAEAEVLFAIIGDFRRKGISVLYISHRIPEVLRICDRVTVLRDGEFVATLTVSRTTPREIISNMVGREISHLYPPKSDTVAAPLLEVRDLRRKGAFSGIGFTLRQGEILGLAGLVGAGRTEVARGVCGIDPLDGGEILLRGERLHLRNYGDAIARGICYLSEDRKQEGLFLPMSVRGNIAAAGIDALARLGVISSRKESGLADAYVRKLNVKTAGLGKPVNDLSGGNQQKVMIAKWLSLNPAVIFMDEPTRGIDVGAKSEIHATLRKLTREGMGVIVISSELPEIIGMCDRVIVMHEGAIVGEVAGAAINERDIMTLAAGEQRRQGESFARPANAGDHYKQGTTG